MAAMDPLLQERVYHALKADYLAGTFVPGRRLDIQELAMRHRASKTPVREAACIMVGQGLLVHHPDGGFTVPVDEPRDIIELYDCHMQMILAVISGLKESAVRRTLLRFADVIIVPTAIDMAQLTTEIFVALSADTGNRRLAADVRRTNERLHYVRIAEPFSSSTAVRELQNFINADVKDIHKSMRRRVESYHLRRIDRLKSSGVFAP